MWILERFAKKLEDLGNSGNIGKINENNGNFGKNWQNFEGFGPNLGGFVLGKFPKMLNFSMNLIFFPTGSRSSGITAPHPREFRGFFGRQDFDPKGFCSL